MSSQGGEKVNPRSRPNLVVVRKVSKSFFMSIWSIRKDILFFEMFLLRMKLNWFVNWFVASCWDLQKFQKKNGKIFLNSYERNEKIWIVWKKITNHENIWKIRQTRHTRPPGWGAPGSPSAQCPPKQEVECSDSGQSDNRSPVFWLTQGNAEDFFTWGGNFFFVCEGMRNFLSAPGKFLTAPPIFAFYLGR